jgi:hypothetical protein
VPLEEPRHLPFCAYPKAADVSRHGIQPLPDELPLVDFDQARPYRSRQVTTVPIHCLSPAQVLEMAEMVGASFVRWEPQTRHIQPPLSPPAGLMDALHRDPFGMDAFGPWTKENLMTWFIRLFLLTDPTSPQSAIRVNEEALTQSLAIVDENGTILGGAFNEPMPPLDVPFPLREEDLFLTAAFAFVEPIFDLLWAQDQGALAALSAQYPAFQDAYARGRVGHHFMVARSEALPKADAFELVAASAAHYQALGYPYVVVEASNQWTGAACEALNGVRVHFAPYQARPTVRQSKTPLEGFVTSPNGYVSDKDSGCMFYVLRLA